MRVFGIDCGIAITGWAVLEEDTESRNSGCKIIDFGVIRTKSNLDMSQRLSMLYDDIVEKINEFKPDCAAIESLFYFKNKKTIISIGQARGVIILAIEKKGLRSYDYTPLQVKQAVTGYGRATKNQVQRMVKTILKLEEIPKPDDAADAIAIAVCHLNTKS